MAYNRVLIFATEIPPQKKIENKLEPLVLKVLHPPPQCPTFFF